MAQFLSAFFLTLNANSDYEVKVCRGLFTSMLEFCLF